jgi:hypothetical protein
MILYTEVITGENRGCSRYQVVRIPRNAADMNRNHFFYTSTELPNTISFRNILLDKTGSITKLSIIFSNTSQACKMRWAGHVARMGRGEAYYRVLVGKPGG